MGTRLEERKTSALTPEAAAVAVIDTVLSAGAHRGAFTRDEALATVEDLRQCLGASELAAPVASVLEDARLSYDGDLLIDRWRVFDPLLDIRTLLSE